MIKILLLMMVAVMMIATLGCGVSLKLGFGGPDAPTNLVASSQSNQIILSWNTVTEIGNSTDTITYNVYRGSISGTTSDKTKIASNIGSPTYTDTSITPGTTYYYQVTAVDSTGESLASNQVSINISQDTNHFNLNATIISGRVVLDWYVFTGATGYNIYRSPTSGTVFTKSLIASNIAATTFTDTTFTAGVTNYYMVTAITSTGESPSSNEATAAP